MTRDEIKDVILEIIEDIDEEADFASLDADAPLRDQLDLDSMDFLDIVMELRKRYKLQIPGRGIPATGHPDQLRQLSRAQTAGRLMSLQGDRARPAPAVPATQAGAHG